MGIWLKVNIQVPGSTSRPCGILLWDPLGDTLLHALGQLSSDEAMEDVEPFWLELPDWLSSMTAEMGGLELVELLESGCSHVLQLSSRTEVQISEPRNLLQDLFEMHVAPFGQPRFNEAQLAAAQARLPTLPSSALQIITALNNPMADLKEVERYISRDPIISAHLIRLANLAGLQVREPARTLSGALQRIGFDKARMHVIALTIGKMYSSPTLRSLWEHSIEVAQVARQIATKVGYSGDEAALVALLHDIGTIVLFGLGEEVIAWYSDMQKAGKTNLSIEKQLSPCNHSEIGARLLSEWRLPNDMCEAVANHHAPSRSKLELTSIIHLAESWVEGNEDAYDISEHSKALSRLGLLANSLNKIKKELDLDLQVLRSIA